MENKIVIKCPSCKRDLRVPYIKDKSLKVTCPHCSYQFETFPKPQTKPFFDNKYFVKIKLFYQNIKFKFLKYKHDPYYRTQLNNNGTITLLIIGTLLLINLLLKIFLRY